MRNPKGDGTRYFEEVIQKINGMTEQQKIEQEKWWKETEKKFKVIGGNDDGAREEDTN